jgi:hypothetical protein
MKRLGFVSNSSSSSFVAFGVSFDKDVLEAFIDESDDFEEKVYELMNRLFDSSEIDYNIDEDTVYVGLPAVAIEDEETGAQFKKRAKQLVQNAFADLTENNTFLFKDEEFNWIEEVVQT